MFFEISEWSNRKDLIRRMTDEEKQHQQMLTQQGPAAQVQGKIAVDKNKAALKSDLNAESNSARATEIVLRRSLESAMSPEVLTGQAGGPYGEEGASGQ